LCRRFSSEFYIIGTGAILPACPWIQCGHVTPVLRQLHWLPDRQLCSRSLGSYVSRSLARLPCTSQMTVAFCRTLVFAHCGPIAMTCGSCSCYEHIINLVMGVSRPPVLDWNDLPLGLWRPGLTFDSFRQSLKCRLFGDRTFSAYLIYRCYTNKLIYQSQRWLCCVL